MKIIEMLIKSKVPKDCGQFHKLFPEFLKKKINFFNSILYTLPQVWPGGVALARALPALGDHARGRGVEVGAGLGVGADRRIFWRAAEASLSCADRRLF